MRYFRAPISVLANRNLRYSAAFFGAGFFFAGAFFLAAGFFFAAVYFFGFLALISSMACSRETLSLSMSSGRVALVFSHLTYGP